MSGSRRGPPDRLRRFGRDERDLPDMEKLEDAGRLGRASSDAPGARLGDSALRAELAGALGGIAGEDDLEGDEG